MTTPTRAQREVVLAMGESWQTTKVAGIAAAMAEQWGGYAIERLAA